MWLPYYLIYITSNFMVNSNRSGRARIAWQDAMQQKPSMQKVHNKEVRQIKLGKLAQQTSNIKDFPLSPQQQSQMDRLGQRYSSIAEVFNPANNRWEMASAGIKAYNNLVPQNRQINKQNVVKVITDTAEKAQKVFQGVPNKPSSEKNVMNSSYGLSKAPNPKPIALNSNVAANTSANDYMQAKLNLCSPMHVSGVTLQIPTSGDLFNYFNQTIAFDIQTRAQSNVSYSLDIANRISTAQLLTAFNATIRALNVYFYYTSILSYESDARNKNQGMIDLRQKITPQIISDLSRLGRRLEDTPIPPRIVEWVRYMNGNFYSGNSQGASLLKLCFNPAALNDPNLGAVQTALTDLTTDANNSLFSLLRSAVPQWRIKKLYDVPTIPQFDKNFLTIFANLPASAIQGALSHNLPNVTNNTDVISYNVYNNKLDGVAFAMTSCGISGIGWFPGIVQPAAFALTAGVSDNRYSWYTDGTTNSWTNVSGNAYLRFARLESYNPASIGGAVTTVHLPGAEKAQNVNILALYQTAQNVLDFLFQIDGIPVNGKLSSFNRQGNGKI